MPRKDKLSFLFGLLFFSGLSQVLAQPVSGYQGKHFLLKTDLLNPVLNKTFRTELEAVLARTFTLGLETTVRFNKFANSNQQDGRIRYQHFALNGRWFPGGGILPPIGPYVMTGLGLGPVRIDWNESANMYGPGGPRKDNFLVFSYSLGVGVQRVFLRRIVVDYSATLHYAFEVASLPGSTGYAKTGDPYLIPSTIGLQQIAPNAATYLEMNFFLKVGILLF